VRARRVFGQDLSDSFAFTATKYLVPTCSSLQDDSKLILQTSLNDNKIWWSTLRRKGRNCQWSDYLPLGWSFCHLRQDLSRRNEDATRFCRDNPLSRWLEIKSNSSNPSPKLLKTGIPKVLSGFSLTNPARVHGDPGISLTFYISQFDCQLTRIDLHNILFDPKSIGNLRRCDMRRLRSRRC
jgi:hypothetical protein